MMKNETTGYHIFLEPEGALKEELAATIQSLAQAYGGPVFPPHVTLAGPIEGQDEEAVIDKAKALAAGFAPLTLTLGGLEGEDAYFRAFYIRIETSEALISYHERASAAFGMSADTYRPHLSLFYGNIDDEVREKMREALRPPTENVFVASSIHIYRTQGPAEEWQKVTEVPF